jgi:hypothetical protein
VCIHARNADAISDAGSRRHQSRGSPAEAWAGEPFLEPDDDPLEVVRPGSAMRKALEDALVEIDAGLTGPSPAWKTRY